MKYKALWVTVIAVCILFGLSFDTGTGLYAFSLKEARVYKNNEFLPSPGLLDKFVQASQLMASLYKGLDAQLLGILADSQVVIRAFEKNKPEDTEIITVALSLAEQEKTLTLFLDHNNLTSRDVARVLVYLAWQLMPTTDVQKSKPILTSSFSVEPYLANTSFASFSIPYFSSVLPNGNLVISALSQLLELSPQLNFVASFGKDLASKGTYPGYEVQTSPSGALLSRAASGGDLYLFNQGIQEARLVRTGISLISSLAYLSDGSILVKDASSHRLLRIDGTLKQELSLPDLRTGYSNLKIAAGEDATFASFDPSAKFLSLHTRDGNLIDRLIPLLDETSLGSITSFKLTPQGYLFLANSFICLVDHQGLPMWRLNFSDFSFGADFLGAQSISFAPKTGSIYINSPLSRLVYQFADLLYCEQFGINTEGHLRMAKIQAALQQNPDDPLALKQKSAALLQEKSFEQALYYLEKLTALQAGDSESRALVIKLKSDQLKHLSDDLVKTVRQTIVRIGPETARPDYSRLMALYEQRLLLQPGNATIQTERSQIAKLLRDAEAYLIEADLPLQIVKLNVDSVFPALLTAYQNKQLGTLVLQNQTGKDAKKVKASISIQRFMDFANDSKVVEQLGNGEQVQLDLFALLNQEVLTIEEDLPVQVKVTISWLSDGKPMTLDTSIITTFYKRTALSWDNSAHLASFITPNEEQVSNFALRAIEAMSVQKDQLSLTPVLTKIKQASAIVDAVAALGMTYLEDPHSPISRILGKSEIVDTVRFARTTLLYKSGDCDDTTALLASLFEAAGIKTAIMTTPGHVFLAFDTQEDIASKWLFGADLQVINHNNTLWIPLESTVLNAGLLGSWKAASDLIKRHQATQIEFIEAASARAQYPAIPLPQASYNIGFPATALIDATLSRSLEALYSHFYLRNVSQIEGSLGQDMRQNSSLLNRLGILQARFGFASKAKESFRRLLAADRANVSAMINLGNLLLFEGDLGTAMYFVSEAKKIRPAHASLKLLEAQVVYAMGDQTKSHTAWLELKSLDTEAGQSATRASQALKVVPVWLYD